MDNESRSIKFERILAVFILVILIYPSCCFATPLCSEPHPAECDLKIYKTETVGYPPHKKVIITHGKLAAPGTSHSLVVTTSGTLQNCSLIAATGDSSLVINNGSGGPRTLEPACVEECTPNLISLSANQCANDGCSINTSQCDQNHSLCTAPANAAVGVAYPCVNPSGGTNPGTNTSTDTNTSTSTSIGTAALCIPNGSNQACSSNTECCDNCCYNGLCSAFVNWCVPPTSTDTGTGTDTSTSTLSGTNTSTSTNTAITTASTSAAGSTTNTGTSTNTATSTNTTTNTATNTATGTGSCIPCLIDGDCLSGLSGVGGLGSPKNQIFAAYHSCNSGCCE